MSCPLVWCIGGIDSSGGAGITRDVITLADLGIHTCPITTQIAVQSNQRMLSSDSTKIAVLSEQLQVLADDIKPKAIKLGAIANNEQARLLCARIQSLPEPRPFVVWDPVLCSSSGGTLSQLNQKSIEQLISTVDLITPNIVELSVLTGEVVDTNDSLFASMKKLISMGANSVLAKGGHASWQVEAVDTFMTKEHIREFAQPRNTLGKLRGTGCMQACAITAFLVKGYRIDDALTLANAYLKQVRDVSVTGNDTRHFGRTVGFPRESQAFPKVYFGGNDPVKKITNLTFPAVSNSKLGIYPVVDDVSWIEALLPTGVNIIQLRLKKGSSDVISNQIKRAVELTQGTRCQLFINDHWQLAIEHGAYGVHLGQEDIVEADLTAISAAGLRLGISTHGYAEIQRIKILKPSYIALGHIFPTKTKNMRSQPQGVKRLKNYVALCGDTPTVAIGGINMHRAKVVSDTGVNSIAVVTAITQADDFIAAYHGLSKEAGFAD